MHLDQEDSVPMRTKPKRAAVGLALALAMTLAPDSSAWAQTQPSTPPTTSPPATTPPAPPPATPSAAKATTPLHLNLQQATELALRQQPTIRSAQGSLVAAQARVPQAKSAYYPRFDVQAGVQKSEFKSSTTGKRTQSDNTFATILGNQLIYDFGKTAALVDEARAGSRVASG
jgi:outer membrane protein TolC